MPAFNGEASPFYGHFASVGGSPAGLVRTVLTDPSSVVSALTTQDDLEYVLLLSAPLAGAFLLAPGLAAVALPQFGINVLADLPTTNDPRTHYVAGVLPFLVAASAMGLVRVRPRHRAFAAAAILLVAAVFASAFGRPWPGPSELKAAPFHPKLSTAHVRALRGAVALVPPEAPVSSTNTLGAHLAARRYWHWVPFIRNAEWIVVDSDDTRMRIAGVPEGVYRARMNAFLMRLQGSSGWQQVYERDRVFVFRRSSERS